MVCDRCAANTAKLCTNAPTAPLSSADRTEERKLGANMLLKARAKHRLNPISQHCRVCEKSTLGGMHYCQKCAYSRGICSMCGRKILDTTFYKMSTT